MSKLGQSVAFINEWLAPLIERGIYLIPIHGVTQSACGCQGTRWGRPNCSQWGKHPVRPWKEIKRLEPIDCRRILDEYFSIAGVPCNWAFKLGSSRLACIDVDMHAGGADGEANFAKLLAEHGAEPFAATPADTRGHYFFSLPVGIADRWPTKIDLAPGVELLTGNSEHDHYVIVPPSEHRDGRPYRWLEGRDLRHSNPLPLPQWVVDAANRYVDEQQVANSDRRCSSESGAGPSPVSINLPRDEHNKILDRARQYMSRVPGAVSGHGGHDHTLHAAGVLINGFGLSQAEAFPILADWNASCQPPWRDADLRRKIAEAERLGPMAGKRRGHLAEGNRPSPFRDLYADEEFAFAKNIRPVLVKPADRRAGPADDAPPPAPTILPLILAGATLGGDRLASNRFADICSPAAAAVAREAEAQSVERREALRVADELRAMRLRKFMCPALRRVLLQHRHKRYSRILHHRCDRWGCEGCGQLFRAQWIETARLRLNNHPWPTDSLFESRVFYRGSVPRSHWQRVYKRLKRLAANYYRIAPDGPDGIRDFIVVTTHAAALRGYNPQPVDATAALNLISSLLHGYHGDRRPISSSHPWAIPKREKTGPPQWTRIGKVDRNLSELDIEEIAQITGCEMRERAPPESARFRIIRVQDLAHAPDMQQSDVDYLHAVLMGQATIEGWNTRDVKFRLAGSTYGSDRSDGSDWTDEYRDDDRDGTHAGHVPKRGGWAVGRNVDLAAI